MEDQHWLEINFKPKYSKWLRTMISEVNGKLKDIAELVEEDADSFARRAEMYFDNRPQLMNMVQELYQSYQILAERYDHATGALSQTHEICEAFSYQSIEPPHDTSDMMKNGSMSDMDKKLKGTIELLEGVADSFAKRAEMYYKHRPKLMKLVEELYRVYQTLAERYDAAAMSLNQAYHMISGALLNRSALSTSVSEPGTPDLATHGKFSLDHDELQNGAIESPRSVQMIRRSITFSEANSVSEIASMQKEISNLSNENHDLKDRLEKENKRANKAEAELSKIKGEIKRLGIEKEDAESQCRVYYEQAMQMEAEVERAHSDTKGLADGWSREVQKLSALENANLELKRELARLKREFEPSVVKSEKIAWMPQEEFPLEPWIIQKQQHQYEQEQHNENDDMISYYRDEVENIKHDAEDTIDVLKNEIERLNELNLSYEINKNELENERNKLMGKNKRLESEIEYLREKLWVYIGKQEKVLFNTESRLGGDNHNSASLESFNWSKFLYWMFFGRLRLVNSRMGAIFQSLVKAVMNIYRNYSSKWIRKRDDHLKTKLLILDANKTENEGHENHESSNEKEEMDDIQIISQQ